MGAIGEREKSEELVAAQQLEEAAGFLDLETWIMRRLHQCEREIVVNLEIIADHGEPMMFRGVRMQHSSARGPYMGPLIFSKDLSEAGIRARAMELSWQSALWGLPFGGSVGWIGVSLDELSEREARLLTREFIHGLSGLVGYNSDVITPERGGHRQVTAWALGALGRTEREHLAAITGKPASLGGTDRERIAARFERAIAVAALNECGTKLAGARVAIAGFDPEARALASTLEEAGARVVAVADRSGAVFHPSRLDVNALLHFVEKEEVVFGYQNAQVMPVEELMRLPVDLLVLSSEHALRIPTQARVVLEAGGSVTCMMPDKCMVVPALLADAGGRMADFLEWKKTACGVQCDGELLQGSRGCVRRTWTETWNYAQQHELTLQQAAMGLAVSRVAEAVRMK